MRDTTSPIITPMTSTDAFLVEPAEGNEDDEPAPWLDRAVTAAAGAFREQVARLHSVIAPPDSTE